MPDHPGASVADERALIAWDGATENILMSLSVAGSSDKAAWVMPGAVGRGGLTGLILLGMLGVGGIVTPAVPVRLAFRKPLQRKRLHQIGDRVAELLRRGL